MTTLRIFNITEGKVYVRFDSPGHEGEYTINLEGYDMQNYIPNNISVLIQNELGSNWIVSNRGSRLEIMNRKYGHRDDNVVQSCLSKILNPLGFII